MHPESVSEDHQAPNKIHKAAVKGLRGLHGTL